MDINKEWDSHSIKNYQTVEGIKKLLRKKNSAYLCQHPEIRAIIRVFLHEAINQQPKNIYEFAATLFRCENGAILTQMINLQLKRVNEELKNSSYSKYDAEMFTKEDNSSRHSLISKSSIEQDASSILKFAMVLNRNQ